jgi:hypothetical protein
MDFWSRLYKGRRASSLTKIQRDDIIKDLNAIGYTGLLTKMKTVVLREFTGKLLSPAFNTTLYMYFVCKY